MNHLKSKSSRVFNPLLKKVSQTGKKNLFIAADGLTPLVTPGSDQLPKHIIAYGHKSTVDLLRAYAVYQACSSSFLVKNSRALINLSTKVFGKTITNTTLKHTFFNHFCGGENENDLKPTVSYLESQGVKAILDYAEESDVSEIIPITGVSAQAAKYDKSCQIFLDCVKTAGQKIGGFSAVKLTGLTDPALLKSMTSMMDNGKFDYDKLSPDNQMEYDAVFERLEKIASLASTMNVKVLIDAEHLYFQHAIDHFTLRLMKKYNKSKAVIFNTYQCYLKQTPEKVEEHLEIAKDEWFVFAAKLVRGAYMEHERKLATELGYEDPICESIEKTHENYNYVTNMILSYKETKQAEVMIASHNEESVKMTIERMETSRFNQGVHFAQLYGMCDHITNDLGRKHLSVYKYLPYGTVDQVLPYLIRRAEENSAALGGAIFEKSLIRKELARRIADLFAPPPMKAQPL